MRKLLYIFGLLLFSIPVSAATWTHVQDCPPVSSGATPISSYTCVMPANFTTGDLIAVQGYWGHVGANTATISDSVSSSYTCATAQKLTGSSTSSQVCYTCSAGGNTSKTLTLAVSSTSSFLRINAIEYSGGASSLCLRTSTQGISQPGSTTPASSNAAASAGDLVVGFAADDVGVAYTVGAGYTLRGNDNGSGAEDQGVGGGVSAGNYTGNFTISPTSPWTSDTLVFIPAAAAGTSVPTQMLQGVGD